MVVVSLEKGAPGQVNLVLVQDALARLMKTQHPQEELLRSSLPEGVDPRHPEVYLSDQDFQVSWRSSSDAFPPTGCSVHQNTVGTNWIRCFLVSDCFRSEGSRVHAPPELEADGSEEKQSVVMLRRGS